MTAGAVSAPLIIPIMHLQTHRAKNHIDTNTPVSIQSGTTLTCPLHGVTEVLHVPCTLLNRCVPGVLTGVWNFADTPGVRIFFTLDGSSPAELQRASAGSSRKYSEPILLPAGRVAVKALAVAR